MTFDICVLVLVGCVAACQGIITPSGNYQRILKLEHKLTLLSDLVDQLRGTSTNARYLGCYKDDADRQLKESSIFNDKMTHNQCINHCRKGNYKYAGLQFFEQCYCGNTLNAAKYPKKPQSECNTPCKGNTDQMCGGGWRNSIYEL